MATVDYQFFFLELDREALTFEGVPTEGRYVLAKCFHLLVFAVIFAGAMTSGYSDAWLSYQGGFWPAMYKLTAFSVVYQMIDRRLPEYWRAESIFYRTTLMHALDQKRTAIYSRAANEILAKTHGVDLIATIRDLLPYAPELRRFGFLRIAALHAQGELPQWLESADHVEKGAEFLEALHFAERRRHDLVTTGKTDVF